MRGGRRAVIGTCANAAPAPATASDAPPGLAEARMLATISRAPRWAAARGGLQPTLLPTPPIAHPTASTHVVDQRSIPHAIVGPQHKHLVGGGRGEAVGRGAGGAPARWEEARGEGMEREGNGGGREKIALRAACFARSPAPGRRRGASRRKRQTAKKKKKKRKWTAARQTHSLFRGVLNARRPPPPLPPIFHPFSPH